MITAQKKKLNTDPLSLSRKKNKNTNRHPQTRRRPFGEESIT